MSKARQPGQEDDPNVFAMKTLLICHHDSPLDHDGLARWLASFSNLVGMVLIEEGGDRKRKRLKAEYERVGPMRLFDVLAFRIYYALFMAKTDARWMRAKLEELRRRFPSPDGTPVLRTRSPNSAEAERFITRMAPDIVAARCKFILKESVFSIAKRGTMVMHPGVCPEYRNSHGCFWALANDDPGKVGMTLLRVDRGIDTGPVYGYFSYDFDAARESHVVIQWRMVFDNLDSLAGKLEQIHRGEAEPIRTEGRCSALWGQPWLSRYVRYRSHAARLKRMPA
jgi:hypothetical protein